MVYIYGPGQRYAYIHTRTHIQAEKTSRKAQLADRLINGLSGENTRWNGEIKRMESVEGRLVGDVLVAAAFVSYAGEHAVCGFCRGPPGSKNRTNMNLNTHTYTQINTHT